MPRIPPKFLISFFLLIFYSTLVGGTQKQGYSSTTKKVFVKEGDMILLPDTVLTVSRDTVLCLPAGAHYLIKEISVNRFQAFYDSLKNRVGKNKLAHALYDAVVVKRSPFLLDSLDFFKSEDAFKIYEGKIIGSIRLKRVKLIAGSVHDTLWINESGFSNLLNNLHVQTHENVLRTDLLFEAGEPLEPLVLADNERILRSLPYIEEAKIYVKPRVTSHDTVDVIVATKDLFSVGVSATIVTADRFRASLFDRNLLGSGTELRYTLFYDRMEAPPAGHEIKYSVTNIKGTFISGFIRYFKSFEGEHKQIGFERQFLTPQTKWGGALDVNYASAFNWMLMDSILQEVSYRYDYHDIWLGRSWQVGGEKSRQNLVFSARFRDDNFKNWPYGSTESNYFFHDRQLWLGAITFRELNYLQSSMILSIGKIEDVQVGYRWQITAGVEKEEYKNKPYLGMELAAAGLIEDFGYLGAVMNLGGFLYDEKLQQGVLNLNTAYYSPLIRLGKYRLRNLLFADWTHGFNRLPGESIQLKNDIRSLPLDDLSGTSELVINLESVAFTPWNILGFRFAFFTFGDIGFLSTDSKLITRSDLYSSIGLGCRIRNESLVFNTLELRLAYFSRTPGDFSHWKFDLSSKSADFLRNIQSSRPEIIEYE
jgi:hypothetical protein